MERALRNRLTFGCMMIAAVAGLLWLDNAAERWTVGRIVQNGHAYGIGGLGLLVLLMIILPTAVSEVATLFAAERVQPYRFIAAAGSGSIVLHAFFTQDPRFQNIAASCFAFIIVFVMIFAALRRAWVRQTEDAIHHMAGTVLATLYLGGLAWFLMAIRVKRGFNADGSVRFQGSTMLVVMFLMMVKATDVGAYFGGRAMGRRKLIPWLSPGKTWEGLACGLLTAGLVGLMAAPLVPPIPRFKGFLFGVVIGGIGQAGDLLESLMKRDAEVKDSGRIIPGFGGVLDVIDSPLFAAPFAYLAFSLF